MHREGAAQRSRNYPSYRAVRRVCAHSVPVGFATCRFNRVSEENPAALVEHQAEWAQRASRLLSGVRDAMDGLDGAEAATLDHIGSTSVPGLAAKPFVGKAAVLARRRSGNTSRPSCGLALGAVHDLVPRLASCKRRRPPALRGSEANTQRAADRQSRLRRLHAGQNGVLRSGAVRVRGLVKNLRRACRRTPPR